MAGTLERLIAHLGRHGGSKTVVWAHNSHIGDARQTAMSARGEHNLGQLARTSFPGRTALVGFTTYDGTVSAASNWNEPVERKRVRPALPGSVENLFHETGISAFWLPFTPGTLLTDALSEPMLERAIGVIYRPESERISHYFQARPAAQFDAIIHFDRTRAVEPLESTGQWQAGEPPETYPTAI
jgi:erythromycin esterase-like protein